MANHFKDTQPLPAFDQIQAKNIESEIDQILQDNRALIEKLSAQETLSWSTLVQPLEDANDVLNKHWSPISHLNSVLNSESLRNSYNACLEKISIYHTELGQNEALFESYKNIIENSDQSKLSDAQKKYLQNSLRDFRLSGINLDTANRLRFKEISKDLSKLTSVFSENVMDSTQAWEKVITNSEELVGLPDSALEVAAQAAKAKKKSGYLLNLEFPSYFPLVTYCENRALREEVYTAYVTRASDQGPGQGEWDNSKNIDEILSLRYQQASLLGFNNYAEYSLATKMANSVEEVERFLNRLAEKSLAFAKKEFADLQQFAQTSLGIDQLEPWDIGFASEKLKQNKFSISQEQLRPYFPADKVLSGMFEIVRRLYGIEIQATNEIITWHPDVKVFEVYNDQRELIAAFYFDLFARENKRGGAWMDECQVRRLDGETLQLPVAYLTCNFTAPVGDKPALLTHQEVTTLFHEFGHGLHHMLTQIDVAGVSGINGVPWDAVELPSQFFENWCWQAEALALFSGHYETGEVLPESLLEKMLAAKNFQSGMQMLRQIEFALFDIKVHAEYTPAPSKPVDHKSEQAGFGQVDFVQATLDAVRAQFSVIPIASFNRFQNGFSHIFAGGYAAGYYSYKWAEVLSADAFSLFEEQGVFDLEAGQSFKRHILEMGGSKSPTELFVAFRGREPEVEALLRHNGLN